MNDVDSLAGQMRALKTGQPAGQAAPKPKRNKDSSDEESGTDEEEADTSDTNTDTEDES
jgi:translocation protein SEC63